MMVYETNNHTHTIYGVRRQAEKPALYTAGRSCNAAVTNRPESALLVHKKCRGCGGTVESPADEHINKLQRMCAHRDTEKQGVKISTAVLTPKQHPLSSPMRP